jgi:hypothetical protein
VYPETPAWIVAIHASKGDADPLGCGIVIDERRVLTCRHVLKVDAPGNTFGEIWVAFPAAEGRGADTRLLVESTEWPTVPEPTKIKDLAVLRLLEPVPADVSPAPLQFPKPTDLMTRRWWAAGFPDGDPLGGTTTGTFKSPLMYGRILLDADKDPDNWVPVTDGFSGGGLWSPDHQAVVAVVSEARKNGDGRGITLYQAAEWFPGEELKGLSGKAQGTAALPVVRTEHEDSRESSVAAEAAGSNYALMVWQKAGHVQRDWDGRLFGETRQGEDVQLDADRMWWPIARWRLDRLKALIFITDGKVNRIREVRGVDEETTGDSSSLALNVSAPLTADEIAERLPTLREKLDAEQHDAVQGRLRKYLEF